MTDRHAQAGAQHTGQQTTGNHPAAGSEAGTGQPKVTNIEKATDIDRLASLDEQLDDAISVNGPTERTAERDERGRL